MFFCEIFTLENPKSSTETKTQRLPRWSPSLHRVDQLNWSSRRPKFTGQASKHRSPAHAWRVLHGRCRLCPGGKIPCFWSLSFGRNKEWLISSAFRGRSCYSFNIHIITWSFSLPSMHFYGTPYATCATPARARSLLHTLGTSSG